LISVRDEANLLPGVNEATGSVCSVAIFLRYYRSWIALLKKFLALSDLVGFCIIICPYYELF